MDSDDLDRLEKLYAKAETIAAIGGEAWLRERFPDKDWHRHRRTDSRFDLCDGSPADCSSKPRLPLVGGGSNERS